MTLNLFNNIIYFILWIVDTVTLVYAHLIVNTYFYTIEEIRQRL